MQKYLIISLLVISQVALAKTAIDVHKSQVEWLGQKVTGQHSGDLQLKRGEVVIDAGRLTGGKFVFDMKTIKVLDIEDVKWNKKLEKHLKNEDFFGVTNYPYAVFEITSAEPIKKAGPEVENYDITGELTIKGITHAVSFKARVDIKSKRSKASGTIMVDRTRYGIKYKSGKFFDGLGDRAIYDEFAISFEVVTK